MYHTSSSGHGPLVGAVPLTTTNLITADNTLRFSGPATSFHASASSHVGSATDSSIISTPSTNIQLDGYVPEYERSASIRVLNKQASSKWRPTITPHSSALPYSPVMPVPISRKHSEEAPNSGQMRPRTSKWHCYLNVYIYTGHTYPFLDT
jgi:hypothetical protein